MYSQWLHRNQYYIFRAPTLFLLHLLHSSLLQPPKTSWYSPLLALPLPTAQPSSTLLLPLWSQPLSLLVALHCHCLLHIVYNQLGCHRGPSSSYCPPLFCNTSPCDSYCHNFLGALFFASGGRGIGAHCLVIITLLSLFSCNQSSLSIAIITVSPSAHLHCLLIVVFIGRRNHLLSCPSTPPSFYSLSCALFDCCVVVCPRCCHCCPSSIVVLPPLSATSCQLLSLIVTFQTRLNGVGTHVSLSAVPHCRCGYGVHPVHFFL